MKLSWILVLALAVVIAVACSKADTPSTIPTPILNLVEVSTDPVTQIDGAETPLSQGQELAGQGRWEEAVADFTRVIRLDPQDAEAYYRRGRSYSHQQMTAEAISDFEKVVQISTDGSLIQLAQENLTELAAEVG